MNKNEFGDFYLRKKKISVLCYACLNNGFILFSILLTLNDLLISCTDMNINNKAHRNLSSLLLI